MIWPPYAEMLEQLRATRSEPLPKLDVAVLRNVTIEPLSEFLRFAASRLGYRVELTYGGFDTAWQEAIGSISLIRETTGVVLVLLHLRGLSPLLTTRFASLSADEIEVEVTRITQQTRTMIQGLRAQTSAPVLWHGFVLDPDPALGILDGQTDSGQRAIIRRLNREVATALRESPAAYFVDLELCLARCGRAEFFDERHWYISSAPFGRGGLRAIAEEDTKFFRALTGKTKKCVVLDCDETLWGGIIGEDGISGIKLGHSYPGSVYRDFQQEVLSLYHRGTIVALCSKNNPDDVWEVLRDHPDMVLREKHIAAAQIGWADKATGLQRLADELNIGLDSMVFVDDSAFEINLVKSALPEVETILVPTARLTDRIGMLVRSGLFDAPNVSEEDRRRGEMYRAEVLRRRAREHSSDLANYLRSLEMGLAIGRADDLTVARISQLTQRTNQFNLTTRRYTEADIKSEAARNDSDVLWLRLSDRFGDSGVVGVAVVRYQNATGLVDTLLLSCRVLGRGVEDAFLKIILGRCLARGCTRAVGAYRPSKKNQQVKEFYPKSGFEKLDETSAPDELHYSVDLHKVDLALPEHFNRVDIHFDAEESE